ncbi:WecB/TagA/CpsF family glycosyltransferase [Candidatus Saganbacteria bacterium]|nr:WecB/TagA/CpsF family glycosyltransferase [Candidatus Saganbacteria bacterium]
MNTIELAGVKVDNITLAEALAKLEGFLTEKSPHLIATPNPEMIVAAQEDEELFNILNNAHLRLPDGISMVVVSRILRTPLRERVTGIDFLLASVKLAAQKGWKIFLLGSAPGVAEAAAQNLITRYPSLLIAGTHHGFFKPADAPQIIAQIKKMQPDILFAGLGAGRQEKWLAAHLNELNVPVSVGVGGSFDVIAGIKQRAPGWIQALYIEWLYRLITEPQRWKRQLALPKFLYLTLIKSLL